MPDIRNVEYYRLWEDHTWDTEFIGIPASTPDVQIEEAIREATAKIEWRDEVPVAVGLYSSNDEEEFVEIAEEQAAVIAEKDKKNNLFGPDPGEPR